MPRSSEATAHSTKRVAAPTQDELVDALRDGIMSGEYAPNQRLIEVDICDRFNASRGAVRIALLQLEGEGLVERVPQRGSRVRAISATEAIEIAELRMVIEALCAGKAAERITDNEIQEFVELRSKIVAAITAGDLDGYRELNQQLHGRIMEISGHTTGLQIIDRLNAQNNRRRRRLSYASRRAAESSSEHLAIIDSIIARDPAAAESAMRAHLGLVIDWLASPESDAALRD